MATHICCGNRWAYVLWRTRIATPHWFDAGAGPRHHRGGYWSDRVWAWMREHGLIRIRAKAPM